MKGAHGLSSRECRLQFMKLQFILTSAVISLSISAHASELFFGAYPGQVLVFDDAKGVIETRIQLTTGIPNSLRPSLDKKTIYVTTNEHDGIELIDVATRKVTNHFVLDTPRTKYRLNGVTPDPTGKFVYSVTTEMDKLVDHYEVGRPKYTMIDLAAQKIIKTVDIEKEDQIGNTGFFGRFGFDISTDGKYLYQFRDKVAILDAATMKVIDRIDLAKPDDPFVQNLGLGGQLDSISQPGVRVSLFNAADPFVHHKVFGIARFDLNARKFVFKPIGPAPEAMAGLQVAPDLRNAWTVVTSGGQLGNKRCEFWHFDLTTNRVTDRAEFPCRSRFTFGMSSDGKKLYTYGAGFEIEVYDSTTLKHERTWDLNYDVTGAPLVNIE